jgi:phenylalanyl-tRNA synthetase beta chain
MTTLDDTDRTLDSSILVIADAKVPVAIAGVMGGAESEVIDVTISILLESANFNPTNIRRTATTLKLTSEASGRFDKGLSLDLTVHALKRATQLLVDLADGKPARGMIDVYPGRKTRTPISLSLSQVRNLLGVDWGMELVEETLTFLGFECQRAGESNLSVVIPWWRTDIHQSADLVEEVARIVGYDKIPLTTLASPLPAQQPNPSISLRERVRDLMVRCGYQEVITYALTSKERTYDMPSVHVANPMSAEQEYLRTTLLPGLLATLSRNQRNDEKGVRIFEIGKTYHPREKDLPQEKETLVAVASGRRTAPSWAADKEVMGLFDAKGVAQSLLETLGLEGQFEPTALQFLHPGRTSSIKIRNRVVGFVGEFHPTVASQFDLLQHPVCVMELDLESLAACTATRREFRSVPRFPSSIRDLALILDADISAMKAQNIISGFPLVSQITLFDVYMGKQIPDGKKSLAFRIVFQAPDRTLTEEDVSKIEQDILAKLSKETGASLRA